MAAAAASPMQILPPRLALLPGATPPLGGLSFSVLIHTAAVFAVLTWLPILFPGRTISSGLTVADIIRDFDVQQFTLPTLSRQTNASSRHELKSRSGAISHRAVKAKSDAGGSASNPPMPDFVGPQLIVSNFPDATNGVQTIRRPNLVAPRRLAYPMRLPSLVMLPPQAAPRLVPPLPEQPSLPSPQGPTPFRPTEPRLQVPALPMGSPRGSLAAPKLLEPPVLPNSQEPSPFRVSEPRLRVPLSPMGSPRRSQAVPKLLEQPIVSNLQEPSSPFQAGAPRAQVPALPMRTPKQSAGVSAEPVAPEISGGSDHSLPTFAATTPPEAPAPKAVVVLNAVSVPSGRFPAIPDAELAGNFVVGPSRDATAGGTAAGASSRITAAADASNAAENSSQPNSGRSGTGVGVGMHAADGGIARSEEVSAGNSEVGRTRAPAGVGPRPGSSTSISVTTGSAGLPGISISGGISGRSGRAVGASSVARGTYGITIISGGSSGGASRDLGVFSRGDTVYTVYIPMTDAGGGPDWPIEYAPMSSAPTGNALLTPPVVLRKIQATAPKTDAFANSGPVFVAGIIDENGKLKALRPIHAPDARAQSAVSALAQWEFLPAQLEGKSVATKVLIGVTVMPTQEVRKQN